MICLPPGFATRAFYGLAGAFHCRTSTTNSLSRATGFNASMILPKIKGSRQLWYPKLWRRRRPSGWLKSWFAWTYMITYLDTSIWSRVWLYQYIHMHICFQFGRSNLLWIFCGPWSRCPAFSLLWTIRPKIQLSEQQMPGIPVPITKSENTRPT